MNMSVHGILTMWTSQGFIDRHAMGIGETMRVFELSGVSERKIGRHKIEMECVRR